VSVNRPGQRTGHLIGIGSSTWRRQRWSRDERDGKIDRARSKVKQVVGGLMQDAAAMS
jgi:hypothetical protein